MTFSLDCYVYITTRLSLPPGQSVNVVSDWLSSDATKRLWIVNCDCNCSMQSCSGERTECECNIDTYNKTSTTIALELSKSSTAQEAPLDSQRTTVFYDAFFSLLSSSLWCDNIIALLLPCMHGIQSRLRLYARA
jgi:hypothetical protein